MYERFISSSMLTGMRLCQCVMSVRCEPASGGSGPARSQMSRFLTSSALSSMNFRRGSTWSPISVVNIWSASVWSSARTCSSVRFVGIHRRGPQRVRVHLAEALVAVDGDALLAGGDEELDEFVERSTRTSASALLAAASGRRASAAFGSAASLVASSSGAPPIAVSLAVAPRSPPRPVRRVRRRPAVVLTHHRAADALDRR